MAGHLPSAEILQALRTLPGDWITPVPKQAMTRQHPPSPQRKRDDGWMNTDQIFMEIKDSLTLSGL